MSLQQTAFVSRERVPNHHTLQAAVALLGFDCQIDRFYEPHTSSGFLPCVLAGIETGAEIYFESSANVLVDFPQHSAEVGRRDVAITFRWGGDLAECAFVLIVSAALAKSFDAIVLYQDDDMISTFDQLVGEAREALQAI
jgi:hypothetical protein